jgi:hypothetical protein
MLFFSVCEILRGYIGKNTIKSVFVYFIYFEKIHNSHYLAPFAVLHFLHGNCALFNAVRPPLLHACLWSISNSSKENSLPQIMLFSGTP